jgi:hypothetical protein
MTDRRAAGLCIFLIVALIWFCWWVIPRVV